MGPVVPCIAHTLEPVAVLLCIGQIASAPWLHVQSATLASIPNESSAGTSVSVAAWHTSQTAAIGPRARRARVMKNPT